MVTGTEADGKMMRAFGARWVSSPRPGPAISVARNPSRRVEVSLIFDLYLIDINTMAVDLSLKSDSNNNAVDLSLRTLGEDQQRTRENSIYGVGTCDNSTPGNATCSENTIQIVERLMEARRTVEMSADDRNNIEMTALNLLCLARLQEILQPSSNSLNAVNSPPPAAVRLQTQPYNRKIFKCDYENCSKVRYKNIL